MMQDRNSLLALTLCATLLAPRVAAPEQRTDPAFKASVPDPAFHATEGPLICVDHAHHNFHRVDGRFAPFAELARADGFRVEGSGRTFERGVARRCELLVIANAQPDERDWSEYPYPTPPAFDATEIRRISDWVRHGGRLLLIADHMPLAGAAAALAEAFGCRFLDGFAVADFANAADARANFLRPTIFSTADGTLRTGPGTSGRTAAQSVTTVATFTGQAFQCTEPARPLLVLPADYVSLMPKKAWQFGLDTPRTAVGGWLQGAVLETGRGRVAIFGEAAMFTAQIAEDGRLMGMNAPQAEQNPRFVLNLLEWLAAP